MDLILDRDGTLIEDPGYLSEPKGVQIIKGVCDYLRQFKALDCRFHVISNQSGVARGLITEATHHDVNTAFINAFAMEDITFNSVSYCFHSDVDQCKCRKPKVGMLLDLVKQFKINPKTTCFVGDKSSDAQTAKTFGCRFFRVTTNRFEEKQWIDIKKAVFEMARA